MPRTISPAPYVDDLLLPQVRSADACRVIGCSPQWLKNMVSRRGAPVVLLRAEERVDVGDRQYLQLSLQSVVHLALVHRLSGRDGPTPRRAHELASAFTYFGGASMDRTQQDREPGELFERGYTYLFADPAEVHGEVVAAEPATNVLEFLGRGRHGRNDDQPFTLLNVTKLVWRVREGLGLPI